MEFRIYDKKLGVTLDPRKLSGYKQRIIGSNKKRYVSRRGTYLRDKEGTRVFIGDCFVIDIKRGVKQLCIVKDGVYFDGLEKNQSMKQGLYVKTWLFVKLYDRGKTIVRSQGKEYSTEYLDLNNLKIAGNIYENKELFKLKFD